MDNKRDLNGFKKTANVITMILKVAYVIMIIGLVVGIIGAIAINVIPKSLLQDILSTGNMELMVTLGGLSMQLESSKILASDIVKIFSTSLLCLIVNIVLLILGIKKLMEVMNTVKNGNPFTNQCVKSIRALGIIVIVSSIIIPILSSAVEYYQITMFNLENVILSSANILNVSYSLSAINGAPILLGVIILILAGVFQYGCYLQDEYDSTL